MSEFKQKKTSTGIGGLDAQMGGGIPKGSTILISGEAGNAIELMACHIVTGCLRAGMEAGFFYTMLRRPVQVKRTIQRTGGDSNRVVVNYIHHDLNEQVEKYKEEMVKYQEAKARGGKPNKPEKVQFRIPEITEKICLVIEGMEDLIAKFGWEYMSEIIEELQADTESHEGLLIITATKGLIPEKEENLLKRMVDGTIEFASRMEGLTVYPMVKVSKMRGITENLFVTLYKETKEGLFIEATRRVN